MSMPNNNNLSPASGPLTYLSPDDRPYSPFKDYELGGLTLDNVSAGLTFQVWNVEYFPDIGRIRLQAEGSGEIVNIIDELFGVTNVTFSFDRNMRLTLAYRRETPGSEGLYLYFYDATLPGYRTATILDGTYPQLCHDDKREGATNSDVILTYIRSIDNRVCQRLQRDAYSVEYDLGFTSNKPLIKVGMTTENKLGLSFGIVT